MFSEWTIGNFKSIARPISLQMAPLTVLVGANSSGKSTVLQSILVLAQTLRSPASERPFVLNGELLKLGSVLDILHQGNEDGPLEFGFGLQIDRELLPLDMSAVEQESDHSVEPHVNVHVHARCVPIAPSGGEPLRLALDSASLALKEAWIKLGRSRQTESPGLGDPSVYGATYLPLDLVYPLGRDRPIAWKEDLRIIATHFLPESLLEPYDIAVAQLRDAFALFEQHLSHLDVPTWVFNKLADLRLDSRVGQEFRVSLRNVLTAKAGKAPVSQGYDLGWQLVQESRTAGEWLRKAVLKLNSSTRVQIVRDLRQETRPALQRLQGSQNYQPNFGFRPRSLPEPLGSAQRAIINHFTRHIRYLGPLRDNPRAIYELPPIPEEPDVGLRGEYTASVLQHHRTDKVICPLPGEPDLASEEMLLEQAVTRWLVHMDLVDRVTTFDRGKIGTELSLQLSGVGKTLDLTNVGIGVSQVLPSLVMGLLAPAGSTLLLEQPELHLHPKVQLILGDFLIGLARSGRQCIVESHSEYLVNRLRRRIAEAPGTRVQKLIQIYFVERIDGISEFRAVEPNEYGAIPDWPKGFFDQGPDEAQLIIQAATKKRTERQEAARLVLKGR